MTIEETIYALDIVEHMESFSVLYEPGEPMNQTTVGKLKEACRMAVSILRTRTDTPPNDPLTLEELREMDGEPVWVMPGGFWALVIANPGERVRLICNDGERVFADKEIELVGPVYRRKLEEGTT